MSIRLASQPKFKTNNLRGFTCPAPLFSWNAISTALLAGSTFTRASTATVIGYNGITQTAKSGESRYQGARREENMLPNSLVKLASRGWSLTNCSADAGGTIFTLSSSSTGLVTYTLSSDGNVSRAGFSTRFTVRMRYIGPQASGTAKVEVYQTTSSLVRARFPTQTFTSGTWYTLGATLGLTEIFTVGSTQHRIIISLGMTGQLTGDQWELGDICWVLSRNNDSPPPFVPADSVTPILHNALVPGVKYFNDANGNTINLTTAEVTEAQGAAIDPATINLLMEPAATNLVVQSEALTGVGAGVSLTADTTVSIHGGMTADTLTVIGAGYKYLRNISPLIIAVDVTTYTTSYWVKKGNWRYITLRPLTFNTCPIRYDFDTNTITLNPTQEEPVVSAVATVLGNGFVKIDCTMTLNSALSTTSRYHDVCINDGISWTETSTVANGSTLIVGPMQVVLGSAPTSYIPTTTVAVTRAVDALTFSCVPPDNETRMVINSANVDINDWNGIYTTPVTTELVNNIVAYYPGQRPV